MIERGSQFARRLRGSGAYEEFGAHLQMRPLAVAAHPGALELELVKTAAAGSSLKTIFVDARQAGNRYGLVVDVTRGIVQSLAPRTSITPHHVSIAESDRLALAETFGGRTDQAIAAAMGMPDPEWTLETALAGVPSDVLLVVGHAHLLAQKWAQRALWTLRGYAAERSLHVALLTRPWLTDALVGPDAAFFGFAEQIEVPATVDPSLSHRAGAIATDLPLVLRRCGRQLAAAAEVLAARAPYEDVDQVYDRLVTARMRDMDNLLTLAQRITPLGARLVTAVASDEPPYPAATRAVPGRVASGLNALRDADIIHSPQARRWALNDPLAAEALRRLTRDRNGLPEIDYGASERPS